MLRRDFLRNLLLAAYALRLIPAMASSNAAPAHGAFALRNIPSDVTVAYLRAQYLKMATEMNGAEVWSSLLTESYDVVARRVAIDFERGNTRRIDGWVYAETELRWCASA